jgi:hypothetical protein
LYEIVLGGRRVCSEASPYFIARLGRGLGDCRHLGREARRDRGPNLRAIATLRSSLPNVAIGWALGGPQVLAVVAYTMGARVLEIPFTLSPSMRGEHGDALEPSELRSRAGDLAAAQAALDEATPPLSLDVVTQRG